MDSWPRHGDGEVITNFSSAKTCSVAHESSCDSVVITNLPGSSLIYHESSCDSVVVSHAVVVTSP